MDAGLGSVFVGGTWPQGGGDGGDGGIAETAGSGEGAATQVSGVGTARTAGTDGTADDGSAAVGARAGVAGSEHTRT